MKKAVYYFPFFFLIIIFCGCGESKKKIDEKTKFIVFFDCADKSTNEKLALQLDVFFKNLNKNYNDFGISVFQISKHSGNYNCFETFLTSRSNSSEKVNTENSFLPDLNAKFKDDICNFNYNILFSIKDLRRAIKESQNKGFKNIRIIYMSQFIQKNSETTNLTNGDLTFVNSGNNILEFNPESIALADSAILKPNNIINEIIMEFKSDIIDNSNIKFYHYQNIKYLKINSNRNATYDNVLNFWSKFFKQIGLSIIPITQLNEVLDK